MRTQTLVLSFLLALRAPVQGLPASPTPGVPANSLVARPVETASNSPERALATQIAEPDIVSLDVFSQATSDAQSLSPSNSDAPSDQWANPSATRVAPPFDVSTAPTQLADLTPSSPSSNALAAPSDILSMVSKPETAIPTATYNQTTIKSSRPLSNVAVALPDVPSATPDLRSEAPIPEPSAEASSLATGPLHKIASKLANAHTNPSDGNSHADEKPSICAYLQKVALAALDHVSALDHMYKYDHAVSADRVTGPEEDGPVMAMI